MKRTFVTSAVVVLASVGVVLFAVSRPRPVGQLADADLQTITNLIRREIDEQIADIRARDTVVVVDTGHGGVCYHCFYVGRTGKGWKITWRGT